MAKRPVGNAPAMEYSRVSITSEAGRNPSIHIQSMIGSPLFGISTSMPKAVTASFFPS